MLFFSFAFRFWFEVGVGFSERYLVRPERFFVSSGQTTPSLLRPKPLRFEVHCVQMAEADGTVRSLCAASDSPQLRDRFSRQLRQHGKRASRLPCLLPMRAAFPRTLRLIWPPQPLTRPVRRE